MVLQTEIARQKNKFPAWNISMNLFRGWMYEIPTDYLR